MKKLLSLMLFLTLPLFAQQYTYTSTVAAGDSLGGLFKLGGFEIPSAVYTADSLFNNTGAGTTDTTKTLEFYVFVGDTSGWSALTHAQRVAECYLLTALDDGSTAYSATLLRAKFVSFSPTVFYALQANGYNSSFSVYLMPYIPDAIKKAVNLKIVTRTY